MEWFSANELAGVAGMPTTPRRTRDALERLVQVNSELSRKREGSKAFEYHFSCLPAHTRVAVLKKQGVIEVAGTPIEIKKRQGGNYARELLWQNWNKANDKQREKARERCEAAIAAAGLLDSGVDVLTAFESVGEALSVAPASVRRWYYQVKSFERSDWLAVSIGKHGQDLDVRKGKEAVCSSEAWDFFCGDYLRLEKL